MSYNTTKITQEKIGQLFPPHDPLLSFKFMLASAAEGGRFKRLLSFFIISILITFVGQIPQSCLLIVQAEN